VYLNDGQHGLWAFAFNELSQRLRSVVDARRRMGMNLHSLRGHGKVIRLERVLAGLIAGEGQRLIGSAFAVQSDGERAVDTVSVSGNRDVVSGARAEPRTKLLSRKLVRLIGGGGERDLHRAKRDSALSVLDLLRTGQQGAMFGISNRGKQRDSQQSNPYPIH